MVDSFGKRPWARTEGGKIILRLLEEWDAGVTEHGDIALSFTSVRGNDPNIPSDQWHAAQFVCTREDAREIAGMILRTLAFAEGGGRAGFAAFRGKIQSPALRALADHWNLARGTRRMPAWKDIHAERIAPYLGSIWAFNFDRASGTFTGRLAGATVMQSFAKSFLGMPLCDLYPPHMIETVEAALIRTVSEPACSRWSGGLYKTAGRIFEGEKLILPIGADPDHPDGVLGMSDYENPPSFRAPRHVELLHDKTDWCKV